MKPPQDSQICHHCDRYRELAKRHHDIQAAGGKRCLTMSILFEHWFCLKHLSVVRRRITLDARTSVRRRHTNHCKKHSNCKRTLEIHRRGIGILQHKTKQGQMRMHHLQQKQSNNLRRQATSKKRGGNGLLRNTDKQKGGPQDWNQSTHLEHNASTKKTWLVLETSTGANQMEKSSI